MILVRAGKPGAGGERRRWGFRAQAGGRGWRDAGLWLRRLIRGGSSPKGKRPRREGEHEQAQERAEPGPGTRPQLGDGRKNRVSGQEGEGPGAWMPQNPVGAVADFQRKVNHI